MIIYTIIGLVLVVVILFLIAFGWDEYGDDNMLVSMPYKHVQLILTGGTAVLLIIFIWLVVYMLK